MGTFEGEHGVWMYDETAPLGKRGGFGAVYLGTGPDGARAAVKVVPPVSGVRGEALRNREAAILARTNEAGSDRLVRLLDIGMSGDALCIALELADGCLRVPASGLPVDEAVRTLAGIAAALVDLHAIGILHRDLKPANVLRIGDRLVLADFGIARDVEVGTQSATFIGYGTGPYMAPELWRMGSPTTKSDLYALGIIAYQLITGAPPFTGDEDELRRAHTTQPPPPLSADVPEVLRSLSLRLLAKDPADRHSDARAVVERLARIQAPLSASQKSLGSVIVNLDEQDAAHRAGRAARREEVEAHARATQQARADLDEIMRDALELILAVDDRFKLVSPRAPDEHADRDWTGEANRWILRSPFADLVISLWQSPGAFRDDDTIAAVGEVTSSGRSNSPTTLANVVYELTADGLRWRLYRFTRSALVDPATYRLGPAMAPHGFSRADFGAERIHMLHPATHIWTMVVSLLTDQLVIDLAQEAITG